MPDRVNPSRQPGLRLCLAVHGATGGVLLVLALCIRFVLDDQPVLSALEPILLSLAVIIVLASVFPARGILPKLFLGTCLSLVSLVSIVGAAECLGRWIGFDFLRQESAWLQLPPYGREPRTPTGTVFFRHRGPEEWTGKVITRILELAGWPVPDVYRDEPVITVRYDPFGFRNEDGWDNWEVAVAGDSFTELGSIPYDRLFTTRLARQTGLRVRNLGVSSTGPLTHLSYLEDYGLAPGLQHTVIVFYEGNDIQDLNDETRALSHFESTGIRPYRPFVKQTSLLDALSDLWTRSSRLGQLDPDLIPYFRFESAAGPVRVTLSQMAPSLSDLSPGSLTNVERFLAKYRDFGRLRQVTTWLAYMPCKARVLHGRLQPLHPDLEGGTLWSPTRLPDWMATQCREHEIRFIDLTPVLRGAAVDRGELVFNPLLEVHLNERGSFLVGQELIRRLGDAVRP